MGVELGSVELYAEEADPDAEAAQERLAGFALDEIERIITDLSQPV